MQQNISRVHVLWHSEHVAEYLKRTGFMTFSNERRKRDLVDLGSNKKRKRIGSNRFLAHPHRVVFDGRAFITPRLLLCLWESLPCTDRGGSHTGDDSKTVTDSLSQKHQRCSKKTLSETPLLLSHFISLYFRSLLHCDHCQNCTLFTLLNSSVSFGPFLWQSFPS